MSRLGSTDEVRRRIDMNRKTGKLDRKQAILECCKAHPDCSLREIGDLFSVTKQYVSQIIIADRKAKEARDDR